MQGSNEISINKVFELLEALGCDIIKESWYDEEGIEGTRIVTPNGKEYTVYGWGNDCDIDELIENIKSK